ncbi:MAG: redoxin domain-containing protein [Niabella sp.]|nr:redoxin domain-containing protein [Niabella sp.]
MKPYQHKLKVIAFLAVDCPLSQQSTVVLREIRAKFSDNVSVIGVFPGRESRMACIAFKKKYQLLFPLLSDKEYKWTKLLNATVTPEVFLLNEGNNLLYYGAIDDRTISLNKRKRKAEKNYLVDAIDDHLSGKKMGINHVKAVGCYIEINQDE